MPQYRTSLLIHTDAQHAGNAKRAGAGGVKGIDALLALDPKLLMADIDPVILNAASGLIGLDAQKLIGGAVISAFNLLKIYNTNIFTETKVATGNIIASLANGTIQLTTPANNDDALTLETSRIALSALPRISIWRINSVTIAGATARIGFGMASADFVGNNNWAGINTADGGANWNFVTATGAANTLTAIAAPVAGDVFIMYFTSGRCSLFKNGAHVATHTTNITVSAIGHGIQIQNAAGEGAGNEITMGFMA